MVCIVKMKHAICSLAFAAVLGMGVPCMAQDDVPPAGDTQAAAEPKPLSLGPESAQDKEAAKQLRKLIKEHAEQGDFDGLKDALANLLKEAFPAAYPDEKRPCWKAKVKGTLAKHALAVNACITLARRSAGSLDDEARRKEQDFLKWLATDGKGPARAFVDGLNKAQVADEEDAVAMMEDLRGAYADMGRKAVSEIKNITNPSGGAVSRKFYPMDKKEVAKRMADILATKPSRGADKNQQDAVNLVNVYRLLCGVPANMSYDASYAKDAQQAADACLKAGIIDHGLGHHTDECNLHMGPAGKSSADSVREYVEDSGQNNYEQRGHRAWVLYPKSVKTGFGLNGGFHAMRTSDLSGSPLAAAHSYPGRGFFPKEYLLGDGWSYYPAQGQSVGSNATVRIWRLSRSPKSAPSAKELASAKEIKITKVCVHPDNGMFPVGNSIVFMPDYSQMPSKNGKPSGVYWVSIVSGSVHDEYVVDLF